MPFTDEHLSLEASPRAAAAARRWVEAACQQMNRPDLVEAAVMGTSELVTNAVLHAEPPFAIQLRGTREHPRIEVVDHSTRVPVPPEQHLDPMVWPDTDEFDDLTMDAVLTTFGRGLHLVAMASVAWGAVVSNDSKVVWFEPTSEIDETGGPDPVLEHEASSRARPVPDGGVTIRWYGMDPRIFSVQRRQYLGLRRELRLLALSHGERYPLATEMGALFPEFEQHFPAGEFVRFADRPHPDDTRVNVQILVAPSASGICSQMIRLFDLADEFCRHELLLSVARTPAVRDFQNWFLGEVVSQLAGREPTPQTANRAASAQ